LTFKKIWKLTEGLGVEADSFVFVVCSDARARGAVNTRLKILGLRQHLCKSIDDYFQMLQPHSAGCTLLCVEKAREDLELLARIEVPQRHLPVLCISTCADIPTAVEAMKLGAVDFLDANCTDRQLTDAVQSAFRRHRQWRREIIYVEGVRRRLAQLSPAHREVLDLLVSGQTNRDMAEELSLSVRGVEERRAKVMQVMQAKSLAELVRQVLAVENDRRWIPR